MATETREWRRVRLARLTRLLNDPNPTLRWTTDPTTKLLVTPRGARWELRLKHGAFLRRVDHPP